MLGMKDGDKHHEEMVEEMMVEIDQHPNKIVSRDEMFNHIKAARDHWHDLPTPLVAASSKIEQSSPQLVP